MHRTTAYGAAAGGLYKDGDKQTGDPATRVIAKSMNALQEEIARTVELAGLALDENNNEQLYAAIQKLINDANKAVIITAAVFAAGVANGEAVYYDTGAANFAKAIADGSSANKVVGIADVSGARVFCFGEATGLAALTPGSRYYLSSDTAGALATTPSGDYIFMGVAKSATVLLVDIDQEEHGGVVIENASFAAGVANGDVVRWDSGASNFAKAVADGTTNRNAVGVADVTRKRVCIAGTFSLFAGLTPGTRYFLSDTTAGMLTATPPSDQVAVGVAKDAATIFVHMEVGRAPPAAWTTGDTKLTFKNVADAGWVLANDGTIGDAGSGATTRANEDTEALFTLLWNNILDAWAPVSGGRGASAAADFVAGKTIALPKALGRALAVAGAGGGLTARALGQNLGAETHALSAGELPAHKHLVPFSTVSDYRWSNESVDSQGGAPGDFQEMVQNPAEGGEGELLMYTSPVGGDVGHNNMQPSAFFNVMIKL